MHLEVYCTALLTILLTWSVKRASCAPINGQAYHLPNFQQIEPKHGYKHIKPEEYHLPEHHLTVHGVLHKRNDPASMQMITVPNQPQRGTSAPQNPTITVSSPFTGSSDEKPKLLKTVVQGLSKFFQAIKNWFQSDTKTESFRDLGRRFSSWFKNIKQKILQSKRYPAEERKPSPDVVTFSPTKSLPRIKKADAATEEAAQATAGVDPTNPTGHELVEGPAKARVPPPPVVPEHEPGKAIVPFEPGQQEEPAVPAEPTEAALVPQDNVDESGAEIDGAVSVAPGSIFPDTTTSGSMTSEDNALVLVSPKVSTLKVSSPKAPTPKVASPEAHTPEVLIPKVPAGEVSTPKPPTPKVPTPKNPTPQEPAPDAPAPGEHNSGELTPQQNELDYHILVRPLDQIKPPYLSMEEVRLVAQETIRKSREQNRAEERIKELDSEYEGLFDDDEAQDANRPGMPELVDNDYARSRRLGSGYKSPINTEYESGPPRGRIGTFSKKAEKELKELQDEGYTNYAIPHFDPGVRKDPNHLDPIDALFLEQGLDPLKVTRRDRRNYAIILEWYKQNKLPQDRKHPNHRELYTADRNPPPDEHGRRYLWGSPTYFEQTSNPAPVPYIREKMKEAGTWEKIGEFMRFGIVSNDPNRPPFWYHNWLPGFGRNREIEEWIEKNIPASWIETNFPTLPGPVSKSKFTNGITELERKAMLHAYNNRYKDAANRKNKKNAKVLHRMGQQRAAWDAYAVGGNQMQATADFPSEEEILKDRGLWDRLKNKMFATQARHNLLKYAKQMHDKDRENLHERLANDGVVVIDNP